MALSLDFTNLLEDAVGAAHGLSDEDIDACVGRTRRIHAHLQAQRAAGDIGFYDLPRDSAVPGIKRLAAEVRGRCDTLVLLGIGGSALGPIALQTALRHAFHNLLPPEHRGGPRLFIPDNPDPELTADLLDLIDPARTVFNIVTKSGSTAETLAHYLVVRDLLKRTVGPAKIREHLVITTDPQRGPLRQIAEAEAIPTLPIPPNVGGRFSVLSAVGLFPAAVVGIDVDALLAGAAAMEARCATDDLWENPAYIYATTHHLLDRKRGKAIAVMMPYASAMRDLADWFRQLWAESLGKRHDVEGHVVEVGQTPVKALGATDQHSQVQLYVEGPNDKVFTFLATRAWRRECPIPPDHDQVDAVAYLGGKDLGTLLNAEQIATEIALTNNHRPNCRLIFPVIDAHHVGEFFMLFQIATAFAGGLYRINPFDQPGVEEGKIATFALMDRPGYADRCAAIQRQLGRERRTL